MPCWLGVDVGGKRKGFDVAVVDDRRLLTLTARLDRDAVIALVQRDTPMVVAIDGPRSCAPDGHTARAGERLLSRSVCGIALFEALEALGVDAIEVFPTASWTRWSGSRGAASRARWSTAGLVSLGLAGVPSQTNQDQRDAIAAAVTARQYTMEMTEDFGEIVVPASPD